MSGFENADSEAKKFSLFSPTKGTCFFWMLQINIMDIFLIQNFALKNAEWKKNKAKAERFNFPTGNKSGKRV